jgi:hypothetical protein
MEPNPYESPTAPHRATDERASRLTRLLISLICPAICAAVAMYFVIKWGLRPYALFGMIFGGIAGFVGGLLNNAISACYRKFAAK